MSWCGGGLVVDNPEGEKMRRVEERMEEVENYVTTLIILFQLLY